MADIDERPDTSDDLQEKKRGDVVVKSNAPLLSEVVLKGSRNSKIKPRGFVQVNYTAPAKFKSGISEGVHVELQNLKTGKVLRNRPAK